MPPRLPVAVQLCHSYYSSFVQQICHVMVIIGLLAGRPVAMAVTHVVTCRCGRPDGARQLS